MISVVIPAYNEEKYIKACLDSLMRQEEMPGEIILIDNNSTDKTVKIAKDYPVRIVVEKDQGMIPARNRGFNEAKYDIIAQTDADTILPPDWIKKIKKAFKDRKLVAVSGPADFYDLPQVVSAPGWHAKPVFMLYVLIIKQILKHDCLYGPNKALRKTAWEKIKNEVCLNDSDVHEDIDLAIHLSTLGKIKFDKTLVVSSSCRRWRKVESYFEYPYRGLKSISKHKKFVLANQSKKFVKKFVTRYLQTF
jgi:glycosyltransferase involved in cell wall biosynthesis